MAVVLLSSQPSEHANGTAERRYVRLNLAAGARTAGGRSGAPRLAVLDWMMPGMDGVEVCRRIRAAASGDMFYIILLTSRDHRKDIVWVVSRIFRTFLRDRSPAVSWVLLFLSLPRGYPLGNVSHAATSFRCA